MKKFGAVSKSTSFKLLTYRNTMARLQATRDIAAQLVRKNRVKQKRREPYHGLPCEKITGLASEGGTNNDPKNDANPTVCCLYRRPVCTRTKRGPKRRC